MYVEINRRAYDVLKDLAAEQRRKIPDQAGIELEQMLTAMIDARDIVVEKTETNAQ